MRPAGTLKHETVCRGEKRHRFGEVIEDEAGVLWLYMRHAGPSWPDRAEKKVRLTPMLGADRAWCGCRQWVLLDHLGIITDIKAGERVKEW